MRPDQQRVQTLLTDTVTLLCRNGLQYNKELKVQGLLGITLDDDEVFIVHINKVFDEVQGRVTSVKSDSSDGPLIQAVNNVTNLSSFSQYENVDGLSFGDDEQNESVSNGMQLPVIHAQQTSILNRTSSSLNKSNHRGIKRTTGAARRKDSRSVKQRLASSFAHHDSCNDKEIHHVQVKKETGFMAEYQEIHVKDEPPDQLIITENNEIQVDEPTTNEEKTSKLSVYNSASSRDSYTPSQNPLVMYESLEDCDESSSPATRSQGAEGEEAVDMIECLLYNEGVSSRSKQGNTDVYKNVHISGAEDANSPLDDSMTGTENLNVGCSTWEESGEVTPVNVSTSKLSRIKSSPQAEETTTYHGIQRQDINETLSHQYRDLLEAAAVQGDGYPCAECDQVLKTRAIWMEHMKGVHMNRKYACQYCGETFKWRSSRKRHVLISHQNEKDLDLSVAT